MAEAYRKGDYVSYSCSGVCRIDDIRQEAPAGKGEPKTFYILKPVADPGSTILCPPAARSFWLRCSGCPTRRRPTP